jgi:hypothetical protein
VIFIRGQEEFGEQVSNVPVGPARGIFVGGMTSSLSNLMFGGEISNIINLSCMEIIKKGLIWLIQVGNIGEMASKTIPRLWPQRGRTSFLSCSSELKMQSCYTSGKMGHFSSRSTFFSADTSEIDELADPVTWPQRAEDTAMELIDVCTWAQITRFFRPFASCGPTSGIM